MTAAPIGPMYGFVQRLVTYAIGQSPQTGRRLSVEAIRLKPDSFQADLVADRLTFLFNGRYVVEARVESTQPEETHCSVQILDGKTAGRLAQALSGLLPDSWINPVLAEWFPGVRRDRGGFVISHRALASALLRLRSAS